MQAGVRWKNTGVSHQETAERYTCEPANRAPRFFGVLERGEGSRALIPGLASLAGTVGKPWFLSDATEEECSV